MSGQTDEAHLTQATWNLLCCLDTLLRVKEGILPRNLAENLPFNEIKLMQETVKLKGEEQPTRMDQLKGPHAVKIKMPKLTQEQIDDIIIGGGDFIVEQVNKELNELSIEEQAYGDQI